MSENTDRSVQSLFCAAHGLRAEEFERVALKQSLYGHARFFAPIIRMLWPDFFTADLEFVRGVGRLTRMRDFSHESEEFVHHPTNKGFLRTTLNCRVSSRALRRLARTALYGEGAGGAEDVDAQSAAPFGGASSGGEGKREAKPVVGTEG